MVAYTYQQIKKIFEDKECILLTSEEDFINNKMNATSKYNIISACGHKNDNCYFHTFKNRNTGIKCVNCIINISKNNINISQNNDIENTALEIIKELIKESFDVKILGECTLADFCIKSKNSDSDLWFPLQLKSCNTSYKTTISFNIGKKIYNNMFIILFCIKPLKIYLIDGNDDFIRNKERITFGFKSKNSHYEVSNNELSKKLLELSSINLNYQQQLETIDTPITKECILEKDFSLYRINMFNNVLFKKSKNYISVDFTILGYNIQERIGVTRKDKINALMFSFIHNRSTYHINDNDYYWLHFPDKSKFILISSKILFKNNYLRDNTYKYRGVLCISVNSLENYKWLQPYIYEYKSETEKIILDIFKNLPKKELNEEKIDISKILENDIIEQEKYNNTLVPKTPEKKCIDCQSVICRTSTRCSKCAVSFKVKTSVNNNNRPSYLTLKNNLETNTYVATGKKYNVSDNTIRKWIKIYENNNLVYT